MEVLTIKTRREYRFILALLRRGKVSRHDMDGICGAENSPEVKRGLKNKGWPIGCIKIEAMDRDGKITRPGIYFFTKTIDAKTLKMVRNWNDEK